MAIEIGAQIQGIMQRQMSYQDQGAPTTLYIRDVTFQLVGLPAGVSAPLFSIAVTDAMQWDMLQVGQTCTIVIHPPAATGQPA